MNLPRAPWTALKERGQLKRDLRVIDGDPEYAGKADELRLAMSRCTTNVLNWIIAAGVGLLPVSYTALQRHREITEKATTTRTVVPESLLTQDNIELGSDLSEAGVPQPEVQRILLALSQMPVNNICTIESYLSFCMYMNALEQQSSLSPKVFSGVVKRFSTRFRTLGHVVLQGTTRLEPTEDYSPGAFSIELLENAPTQDTALNEWMRIHRVAYWNSVTNTLRLPAMTDEEKYTKRTHPVEIYAAIWRPMVDKLLEVSNTHQLFDDTYKETSNWYLPTAIVTESTIPHMESIRKKLVAEYKYASDEKFDEPGFIKRIKEVVETETEATGVRLERLTYITLSCMFPHFNEVMQARIKKILASPHVYIGTEKTPTAPTPGERSPE